MPQVLRIDFSDKHHHSPPFLSPPLLSFSLLFPPYLSSPFPSLPLLFLPLLSFTIDEWRGD
jgi:hypothetical protein